MRKRLQLLAFARVIVAAVPYTVLKLMWLGGSEIGLKNPAAVTQAESARIVVGNAVTIVLGLRPGLLLQLVIEGQVHAGGMDHLSPWVFALVYGGFALMAIALCVLLYVYVTERGSCIFGWPVIRGRLAEMPSESCSRHG